MVRICRQKAVNPAYTVTAVKMRRKQRIACTTAIEAVQHRERLVAEGWGVSIADADGNPISDTRVEERAFRESGVRRSDGA